MLLLVASFVDAGIGIFRLFGDTVVTVFGGIPVAITELFVDMLRVIAKAFEDLTNEIMDGINLLISAMNKLTGLLPKVGGKLQIPSIPHADFSFSNPYEGAAAAIPQKLKQDWDDSLHHTNVTKDMVSSFMDELDKRAHEEAVKRVQGQPRPGVIETTTGAAEPVPPSDKELKALERLRNELRAVLEQTNPVVKAQEELMHIEEVLAKAVEAHVKTADGEVFTQERASKAFDDARAKLQDQLQPYEAWTRKQHEAIDAMKSTTEATAASAAAQAFLNDMKAKGLTPQGQGDTKLGQEQIDAAARLNEQERRHAELMRAEQQITGAILDPLRQYKTEIAAAGDLLLESCGGGLDVPPRAAVRGAVDRRGQRRDHNLGLAVTLADGSIQYVTVTGLVDNHDGTLSLTLDASILGAIAKLSFLEQVRFEEDDIAVTWDGGMFSVDLVARAVQETIVPPSLFVFDTVLDRFFTVPVAPPKIIREPLGKVTLINWTSDRSLSVAAIHAAGGNVDGMVVCLCNTNNNTFGMTVVHEDPSADPEDRMRLAGNSSVSGVNLAVWLVYRGGMQRWIEFLST